MKRNSFFAVLVLVSLCSPASSVQNRETQQTVSDVLERQVASSNGDYHPAPFAFVNSLVITHVPGGIVRILDCADAQPALVGHLPQATLRETLDVIVQANPEYRWQVDDGVVNLLTARDEPALLKVRISKLEVKNAPSINAVLTTLQSLPEVRDAIAKLQLSEGVKIIVGPRSLNLERPQYTIQLKDVTVREALNAIVRAQGRAVWEYKERRCSGTTEYSIDFVVR